MESIKEIMISLYKEHHNDDNLSDDEIKEKIEQILTDFYADEPEIRSFS